MIDPPRWTDDQLDAGRDRAVALFRRERLQEPLDKYLRVFDAYADVVKELFRSTRDLTDIDRRSLDVLVDPRFLEAFRYLAGPPSSLDDLKTVAEAASLNPKRLHGDPALVQRVVGAVITALDTRRFPWVRENRKPTAAERHAATIASACLMATQRLGTSRRNEAKKQQEERVANALVDAGFTKVATRAISTLAKAPSAGAFCGESKLGTRKADIVVRLWDDRVMPIECKVSNSAINSVKRLNNDAAAKAEAWRRDFGQTQVVPDAVLSGVYKLHNLADAQQRGLALFWAHALDELIAWIEATRR
jgi:XamI restriction endonuclease